MRLISIAIGQSLRDRREIIVTDLDHEANIAVWLALEREGAKIVWWHFRDDGRLHPEDLDALLTPQTRIVACTLASNAIGSVLNIREVSRRAHAAGAEVFVDAVHYGPHGPIDVQAFDCEYLVCSGYKIFSPHMGFLWGRRETLNALPTFREDFIPDMAPLKIEVGTFVYENVAGMRAAIEYLTELGNGCGGTRRERLLNAMGSIRDYEATLSAAMIEGLRSIRQATIYGVANPDATHQRVPTLCFNLRNVPPATVASRLAGAGIAVRDGHMYSPRLMRRLGLSPEQGAVRASLVHYNTREEIDRFVGALAKIAPGQAHD